MRNNLKNIFANFLFKSGVLVLLHRLYYKKKAVILMYHRVLPSLSAALNFVQPGMYVTIDSFRRHAAFLKNHFNVIPLRDLVARLHEGQSLGDCCAITFDDGWLDNFTCAFGVLQEYQLPATVFLASDLIGTEKCFWPEKLAMYLQEYDKNIVSQWDSNILKFLREVPAAEDSKTFLNNAIMVLKNWSPEKRDELLDCLRATTNWSAPTRLLMNWDEVLAMHQSGLVDFGSHTANHVILDQVSLDEARYEVVFSRRKIEAHLGVRIKLFAYPNGNFNSSLLEVVANNDFTGAVTTKSGWVAQDTNVLTLPRIGLHEDVCIDTARFYARLVLQRF